MVDGLAGCTFCVRRKASTTTAPHSDAQASGVEMQLCSTQSRLQQRLNASTLLSASALLWCSHLLPHQLLPSCPVCCLSRQRIATCPPGHLVTCNPSHPRARITRVRMHSVCWHTSSSPSPHTKAMHAAMSNQGHAGAICPLC
jgi:hypothetical protein